MKSIIIVYDVTPYIAFDLFDDDDGDSDIVIVRHYHYNCIIQLRVNYKT